MNDTNDDFDDLDRALFALPLAEPPPGLRASILRATIDAPVVEPAIRNWEVAGIGILLALATWVGLLLIADPAFGAGVTANVLALGRAFADPGTLRWLLAGAGIATWLTFVGAAPLRLPARGERP
jgi:hypothetical protein